MAAARSWSARSTLCRRRPAGGAANPCLRVGGAGTAGGWVTLMLQQSPVLAWILEYWTITIFVPAVLILVAVLTVVTRRWDRRDESAQKPRLPQ
jgi:hypothetical protein